MERELRKRISWVLKKYAREYGAIDAEVSFRETEDAYWVEFILDFGRGTLPGIIAIGKMSDHRDLHPVVLYMLVGSHPGRIPPWTTLERIKEDYAIRISHLARKEEFVDAVERLYLHMAFVGKVVDPEE